MACLSVRLEAVGVGWEVGGQSLGWQGESLG